MALRDTSARREKIVSQLKEKRSVQVEDLKRQFNVSSVTIRKDLRFLEKRGIATRAYGGALINDLNIQSTETGLEFKQKLNIDEKSSIAGEAIKQIKSGDSILLDSGTTTFQIASMLDNIDDLTVITNDLNVMNQIANHSDVQLLVLGGVLRQKNKSFFGPQAEHSIKELHADKLFLGVDGFHMDKGITTHFEAESTLNRLMCEAASEIIVVTDSSKFNKICLYKIAPVTSISTLITDKGLSDEYYQGLVKLGINVVTI